VAIACPLSVSYRFSLVFMQKCLVRIPPLNHLPAHRGTAQTPAQTDTKMHEHTCTRAHMPPHSQGCLIENPTFNTPVSEFFSSSDSDPEGECVSEGRSAARRSRRRAGDNGRYAGSSAMKAGNQATLEGTSVGVPHPVTQFRHKHSMVAGESKDAGSGTLSLLQHQQDSHHSGTQQQQQQQQQQNQHQLDSMSNGHISFPHQSNGFSTLPHGPVLINTNHPHDTEQEGGLQRRLLQHGLTEPPFLSIPTPLALTPLNSECQLQQGPQLVKSSSLRIAPPLASAGSRCVQCVAISLRNSAHVLSHAHTCTC